MSRTVRNPWRSPCLREQQWMLFHWVLNLCQKKDLIHYFCAHKCSRTENFKGDSVLFTSDVDLWRGGWGGNQEVERTKSQLPSLMRLGVEFYFC